MKKKPRPKKVRPPKNEWLRINIHTHVYDLYCMVLQYKYKIEDLYISTHNGGVFAKKVISGRMKSQYVSVQEYLNMLQDQTIFPTQKAISKR